MTNVKRLLRTIFTNLFLSRSAFSRLLIVFTVTFWVLATYSLLAEEPVTYRLPSTYLGESDVFVATFTDHVKDKVTNYFGILVSVTAFRFVLRAFLG